MATVFAHRGASAHRPENTIEAFEEAVALGAGGVELDVRPGPDGALLIHHNPLPPGPPPASVPTLEAALVACGPLVVNVELKSDGPGAGVALAAPVVAVVQAWGGPAILSSFDEATIDECHRLAPELPTAQLTWFPDRPFPELLAAVRDRGHLAWHPHHLIVDDASLAAARAVDLEVNTWTVDDPARIVELAALGVDGIVTNDVPTAVEVLGR